MFLRPLLDPDPADLAFLADNVGHVGPDEDTATRPLNDWDDVEGDLTAAAHRVVSSACITKVVLEGGQPKSPQQYMNMVCRSLLLVRSVTTSSRGRVYSGWKRLVKSLSTPEARAILTTHIGNSFRAPWIVLDLEVVFSKWKYFSIASCSSGNCCSS